MLVAITFVVLAHRRVLRPVVALVGAVAALGIIVALMAQFASLIPLEQSWYEAWDARQDVDGFAPPLPLPPYRAARSTGQDGGGLFVAGVRVPRALRVAVRVLVERTCSWVAPRRVRPF